MFIFQKDSCRINFSTTNASISYGFSIFAVVYSIRSRDMHVENNCRSIFIPPISLLLLLLLLIGEPINLFEEKHKQKFTRIYPLGRCGVCIALVITFESAALCFVSFFCCPRVCLCVYVYATD